MFARWDAALKIPSVFLLMMAMAFIRNQQLTFFLPCVAFVFFVCSGVSFKLLLSRLRSPLLLLLFVSLFMMLFSGGENLLVFGFLNLKLSGSVQAVNMVIRVLSIITVGIVMVHTTALQGLAGKLKRMHIPALLVDIGVMTGRYIMVIGEDYRKMKNARKLRGYEQNRSIARFFSVIVPTAATILIRGFDQSEMVFHAMHMRGYGSAPAELCNDRLSRLSVTMLILTVALAAALIILEITL